MTADIASHVRLVRKPGFVGDICGIKIAVSCRFHGILKRTLHAGVMVKLSF